MSNREPITNNLPPEGEPQQLTLDVIGRAFDNAYSVPIVIGTLMQYPVYLNRHARTLTIAGLTTPVDGPYLAGTRIQAHALAILKGEA